MIYMKNNRLYRFLKRVASVCIKSFKNIKQKFRTNDQFWPVALTKYFMVENGLAELEASRDGIMLSVAKSKRLTGEQLTAELVKAESGKAKFLCINFMEAVEEKVKDLTERLNKICGPRLPFERD